MKVEGRSWSRGFMPHLDVPGATQFVTFRLQDSINPRTVLKWREEFAALPENERATEMRKRFERALDEGHGSRLLANPVAAKIVVESINYAHAHFCTVLAFVVMPTHVLLLATDFQIDVGNVIKRIKTFTAHQIHSSLGMEQGRLWQPEYYDTVMRNMDHCVRTAEYIEWNPVKAGLCSDPKKFSHSSANPVLKRRLLSTVRAGGTFERRAGGPRS
jgi:REP element-mobilizing transposase RayT